MTYYGYNNIPEDMGGVKPLPNGLFNKVKDAFLEAVESDHVLQLEVQAAYAYEYKENMELDSFADNRHDGDNDDVILRMSIRMSNPNKADGTLGLTAGLKDSVTNYNVILANEKQPSLKNKIAHAEMEAQQAEVVARETQQRMADVRVAMNAQLAMAEECVHEAAIVAREKRERLEALRKK